MDKILDQLRSVERQLPLWDPPLCGDIDIEIRRDGSWWYLGTPIARTALVKLFASVMRREQEDYFLVTPVEKWRIRVEDVPFIITDFRWYEFDSPNQTLMLYTQWGDEFPLDSEHPLMIRGDADHPRPYVRVRDRLDGLLARSIYYLLCDQVLEQPHHEQRYGIWSSGCFHDLNPA